MTADTFSVIVPTYNRAHQIMQTLDSVYAQTYRPLELIIVDDGSTDETAAVVSKWSKVYRDSSFSVNFKSQPNGGVAHARNAGFLESRGRFVAWLDSDDTYHKEHISVLYKAFTTYDADFVMTGFETVDQNGTVLSVHLGKPGEDLVAAAACGRVWVNTLRCALRRDLAGRIGGWDAGLFCFEDREYFERALLAALRPVAVREVLASARRDGGPRLSDSLRTRAGRRCRIECERRLGEALAQRQDVPTGALGEFASRIYCLGSRSYASGWIAHGRSCGHIARPFAAYMNLKGRRRRAVWQAGVLGGFLYHSVLGGVASWLASRRTTAIFLGGLVLSLPGPLG